MTAKPDSNPRPNTASRGLLSWGATLVAVAVIGLSLTLPALLRSIGMGPVTATSVCMIALALLIGRYAPALGLYPTRQPGVAGKPDTTLVVAAVLAGASLWLAAAMVARLLVADEHNAGRFAPSEPYLMTVLFVLVIAPVTEEILYRGLLQGTLSRILPVAASVLGATLIFSLAHPRPRDMILALAVGLLAGTLREVSGTMMMPILAHIAMNTVSLLVPAAAVSHLAHSPAAIPVLALLGGSVVIVGVVLGLRSLAGGRPLRGHHS